MLGLPYNHTTEAPATFILVGIPGLQSSHLWLAVSLSIMYTTALLGNTLIVTIIWMDSTLQEPMYYFLCVLAAVDMVMASSVVPKMVSIFSSGDNTISFNACFTQMYFVHAATAVETGLLLATAFDRYVVICKPLHYKRILTPRVMLEMTVTITIRAIISMTPLSWMVSHLPFCGSNITDHFMCDLYPLLELACTDTHIFGLLVVINSGFFGILIFSLLLISYGVILLSLRTHSSEGQQKALSTCGSHIAVVIFCFISYAYLLPLLCRWIL